MTPDNDWEIALWNAADEALESTQAYLDDLDALADRQEDERLERMLND